MNIFSLITLFFYVIPSAICAIFAIVHKRENPFKYESESRQWTFMPIANIICSFVIIYYMLVVAKIKFLLTMIRIVKFFKKWNKA